MGIDLKEKVIRPPIKNVTSGKIFKPSKAFLNKRLLQPVIAAVIFWLITVVGFVGISFLGSIVEPECSKCSTVYQYEDWSCWLLVNCVEFGLVDTAFDLHSVLY